MLKLGMEQLFLKLKKKNLTCTSNIQNKAADGVARRQKAKN